MLKVMKKQEKKIWFGLYVLIYLSTTISICILSGWLVLLLMIPEWVEGIIIMALLILLISLIVQRFWDRPTSDRTFHVLFLIYSAAVLLLVIYDPPRMGI
jgi:hypothetical protein